MLTVVPKIQGSRKKKKKNGQKCKNNFETIEFLYNNISKIYVF